MAKFGKSIVDDDGPIAPPPSPAPVTPQPQPTVTPQPTPAPAPQVTVVEVASQATQQQISQTQATAQAQATVGVAQISLDKEIFEQQAKKEEEHWMKSYWRPAMGWLYMLMCFCDFVAFPVISMFIPIITKLPYVAWQSLTLSNGGLIHLSFGAILGVTAYGRTQEKVNKA